MGYLSDICWEYPRQAGSFDDGSRDERYVEMYLMRAGRRS